MIDCTSCQYKSKNFLELDLKTKKYFYQRISSCVGCGWQADNVTISEITGKLKADKNGWIKLIPKQQSNISFTIKENERKTAVMTFPEQFIKLTDTSCQFYRDKYFDQQGPPHNYISCDAMTKESLRSDYRDWKKEVMK